jgi:hypothetical protein
VLYGFYYSYAFIFISFRWCSVIRVMCSCRWSALFFYLIRYTIPEACHVIYLQLSTGDFENTSTLSPNGKANSFQGRIHIFRPKLNLTCCVGQLRFGDFRKQYAINFFIFFPLLKHLCCNDNSLFKPEFGQGKCLPTNRMTSQRRGDWNTVSVSCMQQIERWGAI